MQDSKKPIIQSIRDYVLLNPDIDDRKININYLGNGMEYSIDPIGADPNYKKYVDGGGLKQFQFAFTSKEAYDGDARTGIANSGFYQAFEEFDNQIIDKSLVSDNLIVRIFAILDRRIGKRRLISMKDFMEEEPPVFQEFYAIRIYHEGL